jgi:hypothetical protein
MVVWCLVRNAGMAEWVGGRLIVYFALLLFFVMLSTNPLALSILDGGVLQ